MRKSSLLDAYFVESALPRSKMRSEMATAFGDMRDTCSKSRQTIAESRALIGVTDMLLERDVWWCRKRD